MDPARREAAPHAGRPRRSACEDVARLTPFAEHFKFSVLAAYRTGHEAGDVAGAEGDRRPRRGPAGLDREVLFVRRPSRSRGIADASGQVTITETDTSLCVGPSWLQKTRRASRNGAVTRKWGQQKGRALGEDIQALTSFFLRRGTGGLRACL